MASSNQVRKYLAYWFRLGKAVVIQGSREAIWPKLVIHGDRYSDEFEACWNLVQSLESGDCYLEGTEQTIAELLTSEWKVTDCARCEMPVPTRSIGLTPLAYPCNDLPSWPDTENPAPRSPVNSTTHLNKIRDRLQRLST